MINTVFCQQFKSGLSTLVWWPCQQGEWGARGERGEGGGAAVDDFKKIICSMPRPQLSLNGELPDYWTNRVTVLCRCLFVGNQHSVTDSGVTLSLWYGTWFQIYESIHSIKININHRTTWSNQQIRWGFPLQGLGDLPIPAAEQMCRQLWLPAKYPICAYRDVFQKKTGKCVNFEKTVGGVYPNPTSFVIWSSVFWYAKFILRR